jgi:hypothetical protein
MPLPDTRVVIIGAPKVDKDFTVVEITAREAQRLTKELATDAARVKREIQRALRGR